MRRFGELEAAIMDRLWELNEPATVRTVLESLRPQRALAYTTVMTVMDNLHRKEWLTRVRVGRAFVYQPAASRQEYSAGLMAQALDTSSDRTATLMHFFSTLDTAETALLRDALQAQGKQPRSRTK